MPKTEKRFFFEADRYRFDREYAPSKGWAQLDCNQDAWYHGTWAHPERFEIVAFLEGDHYHTKCETEEEFIAEVGEWFEFQKDGGWDPRIDPMGTANRAKWEALGFEFGETYVCRQMPEKAEANDAE